MPRKTHYTALDLPKKATSEQIKKAWRKIAFESHPDRAEARGLTKREETKLQKRFHKARAAWETLGDVEARKEYDAELRAKLRGGSKPKSGSRPTDPPLTPQEVARRAKEAAEREYRRFLRRQAQAEARYQRRAENLRRARERHRDLERQWTEEQAQETVAAEEVYLRRVVETVRCKIAYFLLGDLRG